MKKLDTFIFRPSKNYLSAEKDELQPIFLRTYNKPEQTSIQKNHLKYRPVKPFNRFVKEKIAGSGISPDEVFLRFIKKDPEGGAYEKEFPCDKEGTKYIPNDPLKWTVGTTYSCASEKLLPKRDPFKEYNFIKRNKQDIENYKKEFNSTDHISIRNPKVSRSIDISEYPYLQMKSQYGTHIESDSYWAPRKYNEFTTANRSSVNYNIITNGDNPISGVKTTSLFEKMAHNKRKGIGEFEFLERRYAPNYSYRFRRLIDNNNRRFTKYKGIFTELYDSASKNGNIYSPFKSEDVAKSPVKQTQKKTSDF